MINLIKEGTSNTIAISPASASFYFSLNSGSFNLNVTQDYDQSSGSLPLTKLAPIPAGYYNNYLLFSIESAIIPSYSGFYTAELEEYIEGPAAVWGTATFTFGGADFAWNADKTRQGRRTINTDRAKVVGTDQPSYISYTEANQDGQYTTYNR
tara:strand:+ start:42 stop:500 length:459 start_codon:yes stop_codon:yes gene_type:complete